MQKRRLWKEQNPIKSKDASILSDIFLRQIIVILIACVP